MSDVQPFNEAFGGAPDMGNPRPDWKHLHDALSEMGAEALAERGARLERAFAEEGISGLLPSAEPGYWRFDPVPFMLPRSEFLQLERALGQRAQLLEAILQDIYGPQTTLADGVLPPALVSANPGFLHPCRRPEGGLPRMLQFYAADVVRGPDGVWRVLTDHVDGTTGIARVLENRRMMARVLPELFPPMQIAQLRPFFDLWTEQLQRLAPAGEAPSVALLTPGHHDQSWFEHVLLSRELSCALVESPDLTVRDGTLYLKTMRGLQKVNVLVRRVSGHKIDPLELPDPEGSGIPGLLDALRGGSVLCTSYPGTAALKATGFAPYLPALSRHLLQEELQIPSVPALWLGDPAMRAEALAAPEKWCIVPAFRELDQRADPSPDRTPYLYAGLALPQPSLAPCAGASGLESRPIGLRLYLLRDDAGRWHAMPGGLAQLLPDMAGVPRLLRHNMAKDVWVPLDPEGDDQRASTPYVMRPLTIRRAGSDLPSRVADDFFWFGRYLERVEAAARLQRAANMRLSRATPLPREWSELQVLMACLAHAGVTDPDREDHLASKDAGLMDLLNKVSVLTEKLRDRLTGDVYAAVTLSLRELGKTLGPDGGMTEAHGAGLDQLQHALTSVLQFTATVAGLAAENMVRSGGHLFLDLGRRLERAYSVAGLLAVALDRGSATGAPKQTEAGLRVALELCDSVITYRSRYLTVMQPAPVLDLVLADPANPRSLAFQLLTARNLLAEIAGDPEAPFARRAGMLLAEMEELVQVVITETDQVAVAATLAAPLRRIENEIGALAQEIVRCYFSLLPSMQLLGGDSMGAHTAGTSAPHDAV